MASSRRSARTQTRTVLSLAAKPENDTQSHPNIIPGGGWKIEHSGSSRGFPTFYTLFNYGDELPFMVVNHGP